MTSDTTSSTSVHAPHPTVRFGAPVQIRQPGTPTEIDSELLRISLSNLSEEEARNRFRAVAIKATQAVGACHLRKRDSDWMIDQADSTGRCPVSQEFEPSFSTTCQQVVAGRSPQITSLSFLDGLTGVLVPLPELAPSELLLTIFKDAQQATRALQTLNQVSAVLQLRLQRESASETEWQLQSIASITELISTVAKSDTMVHAAETVANEITRQLGNSLTVVAIRRKSRLEIAAISGVETIDRSSATYQNCLQAAYESSTRRDTAVFPAVAHDNNHLLLAHKQLAATIHCEAVTSRPLVTDSGNEIGVWLMTGSKDLIQHDRFNRFVSMATPHVASALELLGRSEQGRIKRTTKFLMTKVSRQARWLTLAAAVAVWFLMLVPITYRVRCNCTVEPVSRRFAVAPFDGLINAGFVEAGDLVEKNEVLAEVDGRQVRWELSGVAAERQQALRKREMMLNDGNIPETFLAELQNDRLHAEEKVLQFRKDNLQIRSPIAGVVLSGSLERAEAASVTTGQVLFEIGPTNPVKIEIEIPADDVPQVRSGNLVTIWVEGQEDHPIRAVINSIHPRSEIRDARNVFIAQIETANDGENLRPGMEGVVRIDGETRTLGWSLFHKPMNYVRSRFTWW